MVTKRFIRWAAMLAAGLLLAACTFTKLAYSNAAFAYDKAAPTLAWLVGDYVDLSGDQKHWVRERLDRAMGWHRANELPGYREFFRAVLARLEGPVTVEEIAQSHRELRGHYYRALEHVLPDAAELLARLDAGQVEHLQAKFEKGNRKFLEESVKGALEERRQRDARKYIDHLESWVGPLTSSQEDLVMARVREFADLSSERLADRRFRQGEVLEMIRARASREEMIAGLRRLFIDTDSWRRPEYVRKLRERDQQAYELFSALSDTLTAAQREHLAQRVRGYMHDINELTASRTRATAGT